VEENFEALLEIDVDHFLALVILRVQQSVQVSLATVGAHNKVVRCLTQVDLVHLGNVSQNCAIQSLES